MLNTGTTCWWDCFISSHEFLMCFIFSPYCYGILFSEDTKLFFFLIKFHWLIYTFIFVLLGRAHFSMFVMTFVRKDHFDLAYK